MRFDRYTRFDIFFSHLKIYTPTPLHIAETAMYHPLHSVLATGRCARRNRYFDHVTEYGISYMYDN